MDEALSQGRVARFEDYRRLLEDYKEQSPFAEGQEAFGIEVRADGAVVDEPVMSDASAGRPMRRMPIWRRSSQTTGPPLPPGSNGSRAAASVYRRYDSGHRQECNMG